MVVLMQGLKGEYSAAVDLAEEGVRPGLIQPLVPINRGNGGENGPVRLFDRPTQLFHGAHPFGRWRRRAHLFAESQVTYAFGHARFAAGQMFQDLANAPSFLARTTRWLE